MLDFYVISKSINGNIMYIFVFVKIWFYYFFFRSIENEVVILFFKGFCMVVGNLDNKVVINVVLFICYVNVDFSDSIIVDNFNFDCDCFYGMRIELFFLFCWDGKNLYKLDGFYMVYFS